MGDEDKFTAEELAILGETPAEPQAGDQDTPPVTDGEQIPSDEGEAKPPEIKTDEKPPETKEPEHSDDEKKAVAKMGFRIEGGFIIDDEGTKIPAKRWKKLYYEAKETDRKLVETSAGKTETERKFKLFKELGQDKYYEVYPDEAPAGRKPAAPTVKDDDPLDMVAQYPDPSNQFHGMTLREIYQLDAAEGRKLERAWDQGQKRTADTQAETHRKLLTESENEIKTFTADIARDRFSKEATALTKEEEAQVSALIQGTLDWMQKTGRGGGMLADAYFIMNRDNLLSDAKTRGGEAALKSLQRPVVPSIGTSGGGAMTPMTAFEVMTADQLAREIDRMDERSFINFIKGASAALKAKHPGLAWE